jgi:environmental stress-induced protein Ves
LSSTAAKKGQAVARKALPPAKKRSSAVKKAPGAVRKPALALVKRPPAIAKKATAKKPQHSAKKPSAAPKKLAAKKPPTKAKTASAATGKAKLVAKKPASAAKKVVTAARKAAPPKKPAAAKKSLPATAKSPPKGKKPAAASKTVVALKKTKAAAKPPVSPKSSALAKKTAAPAKTEAAKKPSGAPGKAPAPGKKSPTAAAIAVKPAPVPAQISVPAPKQAVAPKLAPPARPEPLTVRQIPAQATPTPIMPRAPIASWLKKPAPPAKKSAVVKKPPVKLDPLVRLTVEDYQPVPFKHQRWTTRNVAVAAPGDRPLWRVGLTRILQDCDFSHFDRMDRTIMMIDGLGFELDFGGNGTALLDRRYNPVEFRGEWTTRCRLVSGPVEVINIITDRRRATHHVTVMAIGANERLRDLKSDASLIFCLVGEAELVLGKERFVLAAGETLHSTVRGRMSCRAATASSLIYVIEVKKR